LKHLMEDEAYFYMFFGSSCIVSLDGLCSIIFNLKFTKYKNKKNKDYLVIIFLQVLSFHQ
ncbi:MAG: hypothetical protein AABX29_06425, partial [Nanoarchaeota archaeon]